MSSFLSPIANVVSRVGGGGGGTAASRGGDNTSPSGSVAENQESSTQVPSRVGVLMVKGLFNRWRRLTVELRDNVLVISVMKNGILKRSYKLTAQTTCEDSSVRHFCFCLTNPEQDKLFLAADNIASKEAWMDTIQSALSLIRLSERKLREKDRKKVHVNEVSQYISRPIIYVKIIRARNLKAKDSNGSSDPYVKITLGSSSVRTITRKKDLNPDWGMVFPFDWDLSMRYINIEVWDEDFSSSDDFLGCVFIPTFPLKDGDVFHQWYPLGKRTHRSAVSGEIEIEIACTGQPDNEYVPWQFLQEVQKLPEFSLNLAACQSGSGQVAIRDGPYGSLLTKSAEVANDESFVRSRSNSGRGSPMTLPLPTTSATSSKKSDPIISPELDLIGFPFLYPSIEFEYLEDISLNVSVVSLLNTGKISAPGVLLLTNFRLIFVSLNRILAHDEPIDENPTASSLNAWLNVGNNMSTWGGEETYHKTFDDIDLSTEVPLNTVTNIHLTTESEGTFPNVVNYEAIKMRCSDGRTITFVFKEDSTFFNGLVLNVLSSKYVHKALEHIFRVSDVAALKRRVTNDLSLLVDEATLRETLGTFSISAGMHHSVSGAGLMGLDAQASEKLKKLNIDRLENITSLEFCWLKLVKGNQATLYESVDSVEGPPSHRIFGRLKHKSLNREIERYDTVTQMYDVMNELRDACGLFTFSPPRSYFEQMEGGVIPTSDELDIDDQYISTGNANNNASNDDDADDVAITQPIKTNEELKTPEKVPAEEVNTAAEFQSLSVAEIDQVKVNLNSEIANNSSEETDVPVISESKKVEHTSPENNNAGFRSSRSSSKISTKNFEREELISEATNKRNYATLQTLSKRIKESPDLAYSFTKLFFNLESNWHIYNPHSEFRRLGVPNNYWRVTNANSRYDVCSTYPAVLAVPATVDDNTLVGSSLFRSKNRFPTLSWLHRNGCSLSRCSQPLIGITNNRNECDEKMISEINRCSQFYNPSVSTMQGLAGAESVVTSNPLLKPYVIVDARPLLNARANQAVGKGVESEKVYENVTVLFMDIANIHAVRKSLEILEDALHDEATWSRNLEASGWLTYIRKILMAAGRIAHCIAREKVSVLVHCSDGWDRTAQLTSLSMILLDPYYRTLDGFIVLIEKEWLSFGHKFADRLGWTRDGWKDEEKSPIFVQFLDCVHQCLTQLPTAFEFNQHLLLFIMDHLYSGWFSNFMFNCEREMKHFEPWKSSLSIWSAVLSNRYLFINESYNQHDALITPVVSKTRLVFWSEWFLRWHDRIWTYGWIETHQIDSKRLENNNNSATTQWVDDKSVFACMKCNRPFSFFVRKHHCRCCGQIFCDPCSREVRVIPNISSWRPLRVCDDCAISIDTSQLDDISSEVRSSYGGPGSRNPSISGTPYNPNISQRGANSAHFSALVPIGSPPTSYVNHSPANI